MQAYFLNEQWMIVHSPHMIVGATPPGEKRRPADKLTFDGFWTGSTWSHDAAAAKRYASREEAEDYLEENQTLMLGPL